MKTPVTEETFKTLLLRELVLEPTLNKEFAIAELLEAPADEESTGAPTRAHALDRGALIEELGLEEPLKKALKQKTLSTFTKSRARSVDTAADEVAKYTLCCQLAVCDGVARAPARATRSLEEAGQIRDNWARHHHLLGLIHGVRKDFDAAEEALRRAMENEPFFHGRLRITQALKCCEEVRG